MDDTRDIERLRRELAEYTEAEHHLSPSSNEKRSQDKPPIQDLMQEVIRLIDTEATADTRDTKTNYTEHDGHSIERAFNHLPAPVDVEPAGPRPTTTIPEAAAADEAGHGPGAGDALSFSPVRWASLCAFIVILLLAAIVGLLFGVGGTSDKAEPVAAASAAVEQRLPNEAVPVQEKATTELPLPAPAPNLTPAAPEPVKREPDRSTAGCDRGEPNRRRSGNDHGSCRGWRSYNRAYSAEAHKTGKETTARVCCDPALRRPMISGPHC